MERTKIFSMEARCLIAAFAIGSSVIAAFAGPIEDGQALYKAGKFAEVDDALASIIEKRPVPVEALELSFNASIKAGRPYTAERRYNALVEKGGKVKPEILFKAAMISGTIGKPNVRRDRLIYFLKTETGWNDNVATALQVLCRDGGDGEHFVRLMANEKPSEGHFGLGMGMLAQLRAAKRNGDYLKVADTLLAKFPDDSHTTIVLSEVRRMMREAAAPEVFRVDMLSVLVKHPLAKNGDYIDLLRSTAELGAQHVIDYHAYNKALLPIDLFSRIVNLKGAVADQKAREAYAPKFKNMKAHVMAAATKSADASAIYEPDYLRYYIAAILANADLFRNVSAPAVFPKADLAQMFSVVATAKYNSDPASVRALANDCVLNKAWEPQHQATIIKTYPKLFDYRSLFYNSKIAENARKTKDGKPVRDLLALMPERHDIRMQCLPVFFDIKDGAMLKAITEEHIMANPLDFESDNIARFFLSSDAFGPAERANFLKGIFAKTGYSEAWKRLVTFGALPQSLKDDPAFKAFVELVKPEAKGTDPISGSLVALTQVKHGAGGALPPEAFELTKKAVKAYGGKIPNAANPVKARPVERIWAVMSGLCRTREDKARLLEIFVPIFTKGADFASPLAVARDTQNQTNYIAVAAAAIKSGAMKPDEFAQMVYPKDFPNSLLAPYYKTMLPASALAHVNLNCKQGLWPVAERFKQISAVYSAHPFAQFRPEQVRETLEIYERIITYTNLYNAQIVLEPFASALIDKRIGTSWDRAYVVKLYSMIGQRDAALTRFFASVAKADPYAQYSDIKALCGQVYQLPYVSGRNWLAVINQEGIKDEPKANDFGAILRDKLLPAIKAIPLRDAALLPDYDNVRFSDLINSAVLRAGDKQVNQSVSQATYSFAEEYAKRACLGMRLGIERYRQYYILRAAFNRFVAAGEGEHLANIAMTFGLSFSNGLDRDGGAIFATLRNGTKAGFWEPAHLASSVIPHETPAVAANAQRLRSDCSTHMPGIYPVDESSPMYPLYVAADELERNNSERSWSLLSKNLQTFEREASKLPAGFVAWGVEQLRYARGKEDALLIRARKIATALLTKESTLTPELAASLMLTRAECYRDQRNYEAAKLEYQSIRNGNYYRGTKAARKAMFRDVDLLIEMGNATQAEGIIELWMSQPDVEIQAQAHYFLARIAFDRKDFEETRKQLDEVFNLDYTHTEARLLHGQWKLATNSEVDDTDVLVGDLADRTLIRPGQELTISVMDRNLGIAGGGNSIPIIVSTSEGKDSELLSLYPSPRNPYLFSGSISTMLGPATSTNHILEVCGNDQVSYRVEEEFLKARGLETTPPKTLRIVDDARLAIGAAAPLAEDSKAEAALEAMILMTNSGGGDDESLTRNLKPGNPLYVVVRDRDRSITTSPDKISVSARTSSGDRIDGIVLEETEGSSGVFRGTIPTRLPPPRAFASDTATGYNPGDAINSKRNGVWKSSPDGAQGKWFEVDTMGAHIVSNVAIMMPNSEDISSIRLVGRFASARTVLGALPITDVSSRYGIKYQAQGGRKLNSVGLIRNQFSSSKAPAPRNILDLAFTPISNRDAAQNAMLSVPFMLTNNQKTVKFELQAANTRGRTLAGLWMAIAVDGIVVFTGQGNSLDGQQVSFDVSPGPHRLEMFFSASYPEDALKIKVVDENGKLTSFPNAWIDPKVSPELTQFVSDVATIHRIKGGFQATFSRPIRLRSLRWEFLGYSGREISVNKFYVQDNSGKMIIPVESDFSDALQNDTLEVAPGDQVTVSYTDDRTSSGERRILERPIKSSFHNAHVNFFFEEIVHTRDGTRSMLFNAYRFIPGDMMIVSVRDPDGDITPEADTIDVEISTRSGKKSKMKLKEQVGRFANMGGGFYNNQDGVRGIHGGHFVGILRTCEATATNIPAGTLPIAPGDVISLRYDDRENTNPGVPTVRGASVAASQPSPTQVQFFDTKVSRVVDTSYDAKLRLEQIRRRPGNERIEKLYKDVISAKMIPQERIEGTNVIKMNVSAPIPIMVTSPSRARHEASRINVEVVAQSELDDAEASEREPETMLFPLRLGLHFGTIKTDAPISRSVTAAGAIGAFTGVVKLHLGPPDPSAEIDEDELPPVCVNGNDKLRIRVLGDDGSVVHEHYIQLVSAARINLMDSTYSADRHMAHVGERFFVIVEDPDRDDGEELNEVEIAVKTTASNVSRKAILKETLPHSGIFTGTIRPVIFAPGEEIPAVATGGVAVAEEDFLDDRISVKYGDTVEFTYNDEETIPSLTPGLINVSGKVFKGSDGDVRVFSKRFRDSDMAVLVQFRLAECLFETAKEFRRLKQPERSAAAIDEGKMILEEALRDYPTTIHLVQGEYLLANLYQELATEEKAAGNMDAATPLYSEALSRFSAILSTWPDSEFAARAQYHKALCLEMLGDYNSASEEYVKMTYLYPESPLVGDASIRLATFYYRQKKFSTAGRIYHSFQRRFPTHEKADRALFMAAQCHMKQAGFLAEEAEKEKVEPPRHIMNEEYKLAVEALALLSEQYRETASVQLRSQALYWAGDASLKCGDYQNAYLYLKRTVFEYPETEWARRARGLLLQEANSFENLE